MLRLRSSTAAAAEGDDLARTRFVSTSHVSQSAGEACQKRSRHAMPCPEVPREVKSQGFHEYCIAASGLSTSSSEPNMDPALEDVATHFATQLQLQCHCTVTR